MKTVDIETAARNFKAARDCAVRIKGNSEDTARALAKKAGCPVYCFPTPKGPAYDHVPPLGSYLVALPNGQVTAVSGPIV